MNSRTDVNNELDALLKKGIKKSDDTDADDMKKSEDEDADDVEKGEGEGEPDEDEKEIEKALSDIDEDADEDEIKEKLYEKGYNKSFIDKAKAFRKGKVKKGLGSDYEQVDVTPLYEAVATIKAENADLRKSFEKVVTILKSLTSENESIKKSLNAPNQKGKIYVAKAIDKFEKPTPSPNQEVVDSYDDVVKVMKSIAYGANYNPHTQVNVPVDTNAVVALNNFIGSRDMNYLESYKDTLRKSLPNIKL